ncbi:hypothetical protein [Arthrobacter sp. zg-Y1110]|nr:hypothetical protein [Arthrobacter sp. zg-Y1110]MCC3292565.1 hypothetical protein [Arthrobacter sp. zg-Y1110]UWX87003.1 hypothetical protein N2K99_16770 [Arthrobacter sp. zg-Y1110]
MKTEFAGLSNRRRMAYGIGLGVALLLLVLLGTGVWDPMAVDTGVVPTK